MLINLVKDFLIEQEWQFSQIEDKGVFIFGISGKNGKFQCYADIREDESKFTFFSIFGVNTPENKKLEIAELLTRINYGSFLGNFEMDFESGEVRFKTNLFYKSIDPPLEMVAPLIITPIVTMDKYLPSIMGVIFNNLTPLQAIALVEK